MMGEGFAVDPRMRRLLGWNPSQSEDDPLDRNVNFDDPETIHRDQQAAAQAKAPMTPAAGTDTRKGVFRVGMGITQGLSDVASAVAPFVGKGIGAVAQTASDLFGGPDIPEMAVAHADGPGAVPSAPVMSDEERIRKARTINERNRVVRPAAAAAAGPEPTQAASGIRHAIPEVPRPRMGHTYTNADLDLEHAAGAPARGGFGESRQDPGKGWMPESAIEDAMMSSRLEDIKTPRGQISPSQEQALEFGKRQAGIKYAAMDQIINEERDRRLAEAQASPAPPDRKAAAIRFAHEDAERKKLYARQIGMAGWPRQQQFDPVTGEEFSYGAPPGPPPGR